jgi:transposase
VDYVHAVSHQAERIVEWEQAIDKAIAAAPVQIRAVIEALQALRGVAKITAVTIVAEVGSFSRFDRPRPRMGYSGMVAREFSSGNRIQRDGITKTGNAHCAEWSEQLPGPISAGPGSAAFYSNDNRVWSRR